MAVVRRVVRVGAPTVLAGVLASGCLGSGSCAGSALVAPASASCAAGVEYDGAFYLEWSAEVPVRRGAPVGEASYPGCNDEPDCEGAEPPPTPTRAWRMRGVDPGTIVIARSEGAHEWRVFARPGTDPEDYFRLDNGRWRVR